MTRVDIPKARIAFTEAIALDPADPLPRLGLGLAKIRKGQLEEGRKDIEDAANLDPNNSLVRSYLGKAYYEERRSDLAAKELENAKALDAKDPTPWFYNAIRKQTENRPVEALQDLQHSIALNDNRAVYRSRLALDQDLASRSASLGRIYKDLDFQRLALIQGWKSVGAKFLDHSGHRLLADSYSALPRHEVARVSELLQSQLLQPINLTPVQPGLAETNLLIASGAGPSTQAYNEFNPAFSRNRLSLQTSAVAATNNTVGEEVVHAGVWDNVSYSLGQLHHQTDGFRENNGTSQDIYNAFVQASLTPDFSAQAEYRHRTLEYGDLAMRFDLGSIDKQIHRTRVTDTGRIGAHLSVTPQSHVLFSMIHQTGSLRTITERSDINDQTEGTFGELQYMYDTAGVQIVAGAGHDSGNQSSRCQSRTAAPNCLSSARRFVARTTGETATRHTNGYVYGYLHPTAALTWNLGVSIDSTSNGVLGEQGSVDQVNPKLGLIWDVTSSTTLRLAAFRALTRSLLTGQTLEPTHVAGFNQLFDDFTGTESRRYGVGVDHKFSGQLFGGVEASLRDLIAPVAANGIRRSDETLFRAYMNWLPADRLALGLNYMYEDFTNQRNDGSPPGTNTHILPVSANYFHPNGFFSSLKLTYVNQEVFRSNNSRVGDQFLLVDVGVGYRLPKRYGIFRLDVQNLFNEDFSYQGLGGRIRTQETVPFVPETVIAAQFTLAL